MIACGDGHSPTEAAWLNVGGDTSGGAVAQLAVAIVAPGPDRAI